MACKGVDNTSLREIARHAGASNVMAVQYYFGNRDGLPRAVLDRHIGEIDRRRHELLDQIEICDRADLRSLTAALVCPYSSKLDDRDGGPELLLVYSDVLNRPDPMIEPGALTDPGKSLHRWRRLVDPLLDADAIALHRRFTATTVTITEPGRRARAAGRHDHRLFVSTLVDHVTSILATTASNETKELMVARTGGPE